jgi:hypothetical protein
MGMLVDSGVGRAVSQDPGMILSGDFAERKKEDVFRETFI